MKKSTMLQKNEVKSQPIPTFEGKSQPITIKFEGKSQLTTESEINRRDLMEELVVHPSSKDLKLVKLVF